MEANGPANTVMLIRDFMAENKPTDAIFRKKACELLGKIHHQSEKTIRYMEAYQKDPSVRWCDIK